MARKTFGALCALPLLLLGSAARSQVTQTLAVKKGRNELVLAVSELGGGWGFSCRLADVEN